METTYKYRIKGKRSVRLLRRYAWVSNQVWNFCAATQRKATRNYRDGGKGKRLSQYDLQALTTGTSKELGIHAQTVQNICEQFANSHNQRRKCPKFRRSGGPKKSLGWVPFQKQSRQVNSHSITYLGKTFKLFGTKRRPVPLNAKGGEFVEDSLGHWWVCINVEIDAKPSTGKGAIGIDLGLNNIVVTSLGEKFKAIRPYKQWEAKLAVAERAGNMRRAKTINAKVANIRQDYLHKISLKLVQTNNFIVIGNLNIIKLAKTKLAKSVYDAGWSTLRNMLRYKASRHGVTYVEVDESFTTQICSSCGELPPGRPRGIADLGIREWTCSLCGATHDRDVNAAKNILIRGLSAQPPVEESRVAYGR